MSVSIFVFHLVSIDLVVGIMLSNISVIVKIFVVQKISAFGVCVCWSKELLVGVIIFNAYC